MTTYFKAHISTEDKTGTTLSYIADHDIARLDHMGEGGTRMILKTRSGVNRQYVDLNIAVGQAVEKISRAPQNGQLDLTGLQKSATKPALQFPAAPGR